MDALASSILVNFLAACISPPDDAFCDLKLLKFPKRLFRSHKDIASIQFQHYDGTQLVRECVDIDMAEHMFLRRQIYWVKCHCPLSSPQ